jgi:hypothetical protein
MHILLAVCFLFIFCHGHRHRPVAQSYPQTNVGPKMLDANGKSCEQITKGFDSWGNQDDWVSEFPVAQQRRVLQCLELLAKKQGLQ